MPVYMRVPVRPIVNKSPFVTGCGHMRLEATVDRYLLNEGYTLKRGKPKYIEKVGVEAT